MSVLEAILDEPIHDIKYLGEELSLKAGYESKGVRLDVYVEDEAHTVYDVEMQVGSETDEELAKRMRYYQSQMDADHLARGKDYVELKRQSLFSSVRLILTSADGISIALKTPAAAMRR